MNTLWYPRLRANMVVSHIYLINSTWILYRCLRKLDAAYGLWGWESCLKIWLHQVWIIGCSRSWFIGVWAHKHKGCVRLGFLANCMSPACTLLKGQNIIIESITSKTQVCALSTRSCYWGYETIIWAIITIIMKFKIENSPRKLSTFQAFISRIHSLLCWCRILMQWYCTSKCIKVRICVAGVLWGIMVAPTNKVHCWCRVHPNFDTRPGSCVWRWV